MSCSTGVLRDFRPLAFGQFPASPTHQTSDSSQLVIASLLTDPALCDHPGLKEELKTALDKLADSVSPIRKHRDKYIAHLDLEAAVRPTEALIPWLEEGISR